MTIYKIKYRDFKNITYELYDMSNISAHYDLIKKFGYSVENYDDILLDINTMVDLTNRYVYLQLGGSFETKYRIDMDCVKKQLLLTIRNDNINEILLSL